jgi:hypothetical protein
MFGGDESRSSLAGLFEPFDPVNIWQVAILLGVVDPVTHYKALIELEPHVVDRNVNLPSFPFVDQGANFDGTRP